MRLDRLLTLYLFHPFCRKAQGSFPLPVLMYHSISDDPEPNTRPYYRTCTSPRMFERHMALLESAGYQCVSVGAARAAIRSGTAPGKKLAVITFDDGFRDFLTAAYPALERRGFTATMYLPTAFIGEQIRQFKSRDCLTWGEVKKLHHLGIEFGSHTVNHPRLVELNWTDIETELTASKAEIERQLGAPVRTFAYPFAFPQADREFVRHFRQLLDRAGYESCVTTQVGRVTPGEDSLQWPRLPANSADDDALLTAKLDGAYDWIARPQAAVKKIKFWSSRPSVRPTPGRGPATGNL